MRCDIEDGSGLRWIRDDGAMATGARDGRRRVLWLIKGLGPGGAEQLLVNQARGHDAARFDIRCAYLVPWKHHQVAPLEATGVPVVLLDGARDWDLRWAWRLRRLLVDDPVDVVHNHSPLVAAVCRLLVRTLPGSVRPALVYTEHNNWARHNRWTRLANQLTYRLDDYTLAVSADVVASIPERLRGRVHVLVHGIVLEEVAAARRQREAVRAELGIAEDAVVGGNGANFRREKDYPTLLEAARRALTASEVPLRFVSVGQGPLEAEMRALHASMGLGDRFVLLGYRDDAVRVMSAFDVFTLTSRHEGLPVALMDACALGLPTVATAVGGIPQVITDGVEGILVEPGDLDALADGYVAVASDPERRAEMGEAASKAAGQVDIAVAQEQLERIYTHVEDWTTQRVPG